MSDSTVNLIILFLLNSSRSSYRDIEERNNPRDKYLKSTTIPSKRSSNSYGWEPKKSTSKDYRRKPYSSSNRPEWDYKGAYDDSSYDDAPYPHPVSYPRQEPHHQPSLSETPEDWERIWDGPVGECSSNNTAEKDCSHLYSKPEGRGRWMCDGENLTCAWFSYEFQGGEEEEEEEEKEDDNERRGRGGQRGEEEEGRRSGRWGSREDEEERESRENDGCFDNNDCSPSQFCFILGVGVCPSSSSSSSSYSEDTKHTKQIEKNNKREKKEGKERAVGVCKERPRICQSALNRPVCGCDHKTYQNTCLLQQSGENIDYFGICK